MLMRFLSGVDVYLHNGETSPLHSNLHDSQQPSKTCESVDLTAAGHICPTARESEDIGELTCSRRCAQKDKIWRKTEGGLAVDDTEMLW